MDWNPSNLCECVGSVYLGCLTAMLAAGMLFWYAVIATYWLAAARFASPGSRAVWNWLVAIFIVCAFAGYGSWVLAMYIPKVAVIMRVLFLAAQNIICPIFLWSAVGRRFATMGHVDHVGAELLSTLNIETMSDEELGANARLIISSCPYIEEC